MLYTDKIKDILLKLGVDVSKLPDNLYSTLLDAILNADISSGGGSSSKNTITLDAGTELPMPTLKDGCNYAIIFKGTNYYSMLECQNRFANVNGWISIANDNYTIGTSSVPCYLSQLPVNFNEYNSWTESTEYDTSNAKFTTLGTLILSNEIIETWSSTNTNTHVIYFNKNFEI